MSFRPCRRCGIFSSAARTAVAGEARPEIHARCHAGFAAAHEPAAVDDREALGLRAVRRNRHRAVGEDAVDVHREKPDARPAGTGDTGTRKPDTGKQGTSASVLRFQVAPSKSSSSSRPPTRNGPPRSPQPPGDGLDDLFLGGPERGLQFRGEGHGQVQRAEAQGRGLERSEMLLGEPGDQLGAETVRAPALVQDDQPVRCARATRGWRPGRGARGSAGRRPRNSARIRRRSSRRPRRPGAPSRRR